MKWYDWNEKAQLERFFFVFFICFSCLLVVNYYYAMIAHKTVSIVNFFAIIFSVKLFVMLADVGDRVVKKHLVQLMSMGLILLILSFLPVPLWIVVSVNNLFALVYFSFLYLHKRKRKQKYRLIQSYVSLVHLFYLMYLLTLNLQVHFVRQEIPSIVIVLSYLQLALQILLLLLSMASYLFYLNVLRTRKIHLFFRFAQQNEVSKKESELGYIRQDERTVPYQFSYKHQVIVEQILAFFETGDAYLKHDFTLEALGKCISNPNLHLISFAINNHLHTTFYKLVAYYRILYSLQLFVHRQDWTLIAIAESVGFKSVNTFNKYFKELTGVTPVEYRIILEKKRG